MSSSPVAQNGQTSRGVWSLLAPFVVPQLAASAAISFVFHNLIAKSDQQKGRPIRQMTRLEGIKEGLRAAPTVGIIIGAQMIVQGALEKAFAKDSSTTSLSSTLASSATVGIVSAPILAVFNGQTMGWGVRESLQKFSVKQGMAIAIQETAFVADLSAADALATQMKHEFGDNQAVAYTAAFTAGSIGSLAGHPANTALTRWQSGLSIEHPRQLLWGSARKTWAIGLFAVAYKFGKDMLNSTVNEV